ncbi:MAG: GGDEF domain-containing protein [Syntrophales bacterium]|jgi:diguanylate cyclase (GGDEF)-like protein
MIKKLDESLRESPRSYVIFIGSLLISLMGYIDYLTGSEIAITILYLLPISFVTWYAGWHVGALMSIITTSVWFLADLSATEQYSHPIVPFWNTAVMLATFLIFAYILSALRDRLDEEKSLSRTDSLTGAMNRRYFFELAESEMSRAGRYKHPFTVAYIDLDNFKSVNDSFGHLVGDRLLRTVSNTLRKSLRNTDTFARIGGDEFAIILPETGDHKSVMTLFGKVRDNLLEAMKKKDWTVTFSIGVAIYLNPPDSVDEMINIPDRIMYSIKNDGKNMVKVEVFANPGEAGIS